MDIGSMDLCVEIYVIMGVCNLSCHHIKVMKG